LLTAEELDALRGRGLSWQEQARLIVQARRCLVAEAFCKARERTEEWLLARDALLIETHYEATRDTALAQRELEEALYAEGDAWREWKEASRE
jgi:hypothetical protein